MPAAIAPTTAPSTVESVRLAANRTAATTTSRTSAGPISALACVRVEMTTCSPSLRSLVGKATSPIMSLLRADVNHIAGSHGERRVGRAHDQCPAGVDVERLAMAHLRCGQMDLDLASDGRAHIDVRRAQRLRVEEQSLQSVQRSEH